MFKKVKVKTKQCNGKFNGFGGMSILSKMDFNLFLQKSNNIIYICTILDIKGTNLIIKKHNLLT